MEKNKNITGENIAGETDMGREGDSCQQKRWVLLEKLPPILTPKILMLVFVYSIAFTLLLVGLKLFRLEQSLQQNKAKDASEVWDETIGDAIPASQSQQHIAQNIIRLHVIANSDGEEDQELKLKVRDGIIGSLQNALEQAESVKQAESLLMQNKKEIAAAARRIIQNQGKEYSVSVSLAPRYFPIKQYGDLTFPAGTYQALCVEIGAAEGRNWWCVLFPSLCFVDEATATVPEESKEKLKGCLTDEEYNSLKEADASAPMQTVQPEGREESGTEEDGEEKPELRSALLDWFFGK